MQLADRYISYELANKHDNGNITIIYENMRNDYAKARIERNRKRLLEKESNAR